MTRDGQPSGDPSDSRRGGKVINLLDALKKAQRDGDKVSEGALVEILGPVDQSKQKLRPRIVLEPVRLPQEAPVYVPEIYDRLLDARPDGQRAIIEEALAEKEFADIASLTNFLNENVFIRPTNTIQLSEAELSGGSPSMTVVEQRKILVNAKVGGRPSKSVLFISHIKEEPATHWWKLDKVM